MLQFVVLVGIVGVTVWCASLAFVHITVVDGTAVVLVNALPEYQLTTLLTKGPRETISKTGQEQRTKYEAISGAMWTRT